VAAVLTQTFHYMIQCGLEYSYITTGEAFVFLRIKEEDPTTLYYQVTVPKEEANMNEDPQSRVLHTAAGQMLSFCLLAMKSQQRSKEWQARAYRLLEKWPLSRDFHDTPQSERVAATPGCIFLSGIPVIGVVPAAICIPVLSPPRLQVQVRNPKSQLLKSERHLLA
jgi:hypothetical protein